MEILGISSKKNLKIKKLPHFKEENYEIIFKIFGEFGQIFSFVLF